MSLNKLYLKRNIDDTLWAWAQAPSRKPLIVRGARQVGKTAAIKHLGAAAFQNTLAINFDRQPLFKKVFESDLDPRRIVSQLEALMEMKLRPGKTLLFFDEIQECENAIKALRYFHEEMPDVHVVAAGSLLEFVWEKLSVPVGRVSYAYLFPLTFDEFLAASGQSKLADHRPRWSASAPTTALLGEAMAHSLWASLRDYFIVGGMPEAVLSFVERRSYLDVGTIQDDLLQTYRDDFHKYAKGNKQLDNLSAVFSRVFGLVGRQLKYSSLGDGDDTKRTKASLELLERAGIVHRVHCTSARGLPLSAGTKDSQFKCIFLDIGLGQRCSGMKPADFIKAENIATFHQGLIAEQFVGQELLAEADPRSHEPLYYWARQEKSSTAEIDYLVVRDGAILPVEIKSGTSGALKSLHLYLKDRGGVGICMQQINNCRLLDQVYFIPLFAKL